LKAERLRRLGLAFCLACAGLGLTGCVDARPVEDRALIIAVGVGPCREPGQKEWSFVIPNVAVTAANIASNSAPAQQVFAVTVVAPDFPTAVDQVSERLSRDVFLGQLEVLVFDRRLPYPEARAVVEALNQNGVVPKNYYVVVAKGQVRSLLTAVSPQEVIPRYFLSAYFDICRTCHTTDWAVMGWQWWSKSVTPGVNPYAPVAELTPQGLRVSTVAVYRDQGPPLVMPPAVALGFSYVTGKVVRHSWTGVVHGQTVSAARLVATSRQRARLLRGQVAVDSEVRVTGYLDVAPLQGNPAHWLALAQAASARAVVGLALRALDWSAHERVDPFGFTRDALASRPECAYRLAPGSSVALPLLARVRVQVRLLTSGTKA
jgi:hypothetical protein